MANILQNGVIESSNGDPAKLGGFAYASSIRQDYPVASVSDLATITNPPLGAFAQVASDNSRWIYRAEGWRLWDSWGQTYVPTWGSNVTVGNGSTSGFYQFSSGVGTFVTTLTLGSTSAISGSISVFLPANMSLSSPALTATVIGDGRFRDISTGNVFDSRVRTATTGAVIAEVLTASGDYAQVSGLGSTIPFTWASGDSITLRFTFPISATP